MHQVTAKAAFKCQLVTAPSKAAVKTLGTSEKLIITGKVKLGIFKLIFPMGLY